MKRRRLLTLIVLLLGIATAPLWLSYLVWQNTPWRAQRVELVDYSVPYVSAREHRGAAWLLNHYKYQPYHGERFGPPGSYAGYDPTDRERQRPISSLDLSQTDWILVTDAYGVYEDDLTDIANEQSHMDYSRKIFGGLSVADVAAIDAHLARGRHAILEFNSMEDPTPPEARAGIERLFGVRWTGWTARTFLDLYDTTDVPRWVPRRHKELYGDIPMPRGPVLAFVHMDGRMLLARDFATLRVPPELALTPLGERVVPGADGGPNYYYWFPIIEAQPGTQVLAELVFSRTAAMDSVRALAGIPERIPLIVRRIAGPSHRVYIAGDLSDPDFDPGAYRFAGLARVHKALKVDPRIYNSQLMFWQFYVPMMRSLLEEPYLFPPRDWVAVEREAR